MATTAALNTFRLVYSNPAQEQANSRFQNRIGYYDLLWSYYNNSVWDNAELNWQAFRQKYNLYQYIQSDYNPTKRLVDFYAAQVYPGVLSEDGSNLPDGMPLAIPFAKDTDEKLKGAIAQFWQWSNWQAWKTVHVRWGAALGSVLIEVIDDTLSGKVYADVRWPGYVYDLVLDSMGNVKAYVIQYKTTDEQGQLYTYRKEVDNAFITEYNEDRIISQKANTYGFVPAVWIKHSDVGGIHGQPAISGSLNKINRLNELASHINDQIHIVIGAPKVIGTQSNVTNLFKGSQDAVNKRKGLLSPDDYGITPPTSRDEVLMLKAGPDVKIESLAGNLDIAQAFLAFDRLQAEIEADYPEITFWQRLREMSQITGPAAERLSGDVISKVQEAASLYDQQNIKLFQMAVAIGGMRLKERREGWAGPTRQQERFAGFDLDSYAKGNLDFAIMPRPLISPTRLELIQEKQAFWNAITTETGTGVPLEVALEDEGWSPEQLARLGQQQVEAIKRQQILAQQDVIPNVQQ